MSAMPQPSGVPAASTSSASLAITTGAPPNRLGCPALEQRPIFGPIYARQPQTDRATSRGGEVRVRKRSRNRRIQRGPGGLAPMFW